LNSLNNRQIEFVKLLLEEDEYKTIKYFTVHLKISCKTLQKDLVIIEKYLDDFNIVLDRKPGTGIIIVNARTTKWILYNNLKWQERKCKKISINERRIEITANMLMNSNTETSIQKLSDIYYVSKTSIAADLKYTEKVATQFNLKMKKNVRGTKIEGSEVDIRKAISSLMVEYSKADYRYETMQQIATRIDSYTLNALSSLFDKDKIIYINQYLVELERKYKCVLNDPYYINLLTHILISLTRGLDGNQVKDDVKKNDYNLETEKSYKEAFNMVNKINEDFNINLGNAEIYYLYQYFVSSGLVKNTTKNVDEVLDEINCMAKTFTKKITNCIEEILQIDISNDKMIMESLLLHVRPMLNRLRYDIIISNPLMGDIEKEYPELLAICRAAVLITSYDSNQKPIPIDEIGYLTLYYQTAIERISIKKRVIVVCQSGMGTSQLLTTRIRKAFPQWDIVDIQSVSMLEKQKLDDIDFIISTVPIDIKEKPYILSSVFLNDQDIKNISNMLSEKPLEASNVQTETSYINKVFSDENIYFNEGDNKVIENINKKLSSNIAFQEITLCDEINVHIGFCSGRSILAINLNNKINSNKKISFYIAMGDINIMTHILSEIYYLHTSKEIPEYLIKCRDVEEVRGYFKANKKEMELVITDFSQVIKEDTIKLDMDATTKEEALLELTVLLRKAGIISNQNAFLNDVYYREGLGATGIGNGIAIPHAESKFVNKTTLAIGRTKVPIQWESLDNKPIQFIILFAVTAQNKDSIENCLLSEVATKLGNDEFCKSLLYVKRAEEVRDLFQEN